MSDLASRLRRLEVSLSTASDERLNTLRIDHAFVSLSIAVVMAEFGPLHFDSADAADAGIELAIAEHFADGCGVPLHPAGEWEPVPIHDDGQFEERVEALKRYNREAHWTDDARAAVAAAHGLDKSPAESD